MNDQLKRITEQGDKVFGKCNCILPKAIDWFLKMLKVPNDIVIDVVDYLASRLGSMAVLLCGVLFSILCLKNMVTSFFFKDTPITFCLFMAIGSLLTTTVCVYAAAKMIEALPKIISSASCKISSYTFFKVLTAIGWLQAITTFGGGIYIAISTKSIGPFFSCLGISVILVIITGYVANPEKFNIVEDKTASPGDDLVSIITFFLKLLLHLVPVLLLGLAIFGICQIVPKIFTSYIESHGRHSTLLTGEMMAGMCDSAMFCFIGLMPLAVYLVYIFYYVGLDIIRVILQLPSKLDDLKK
ncbi:MAG: hypothetical protein J5806_11985 [Lentisphaeria bacterium]|nr:hypothetical protein [Lentisphaeria bacterium]